MGKEDAMIVCCSQCGREHEIKCGHLEWRCVYVDDSDPENIGYTHQALWEGCCECEEWNMDATFETEQTPDKRMIPQEPRFEGCIPKNPQSNCVCRELYDEDLENSDMYRLYGVRS